MKDNKVLKAPLIDKIHNSTCEYRIDNEPCHLPRKLLNIRNFIGKCPCCGTTIDIRYCDKACGECGQILDLESDC